MDERPARRGFRLRFVRPHHQHVNVAAGLNEPLQHRTAPPGIKPARAAGFAENDLRRVMFAGGAQQSRDYVLVGRRDDFRSELSGQREVVGQAALFGITQRTGSLDIDGEPPRLQAVGQTPGPAQQRSGQRTGTESDHQPYARLPRPRSGLRAVKLLRLFTDVIGHEPQGQFAQRGEIAGAEKIRRRGLCAFRDVNFSSVQSLQQFIRRQINQFDFHLIEHGVGHGLVNRRRGDLPHRVRAGFDVLHV